MSIFKKVAKGALALFTFLVLKDSYFILDQTKQASVFRVGKPVRVIVNPIVKDDKFYCRLGDLQREMEIKYPGVKYSVYPGKIYGLYLKLPFFENVKQVERRYISWSGSPDDIMTLDKKYIWADYSTRWRSWDPLTFSLGVKSEEGGHGLLDRVVDSSARDIIPKNHIVEVVRNSNRQLYIEEEELREQAPKDSVKIGREGIMRMITERATEGCAKYGIDLSEVIFTRITYVEEVKTATEKRMISERQRIANNIRSEGKGEAERILGNRDFEVNQANSNAYLRAQRIKGAADSLITVSSAQVYNVDPEFYRFSKSLDIIVRTFSGKSNVDVTMGMDQDLLKYLKSPNPEKK